MHAHTHTNIWILSVFNWPVLPLEGGIHRYTSWTDRIRTSVHVSAWDISQSKNNSWNEHRHRSDVNYLLMTCLSTHWLLLYYAVLIPFGTAHATSSAWELACSLHLRARFQCWQTSSDGTSSLSPPSPCASLAWSKMPSATRINEWMTVIYTSDEWS